MHIDSKLDLDKILRVYLHPKGRSEQTLASKKRSLEVCQMRLSGMSYGEIAKEVGVGDARVRQIEAKCYRLLKNIAVSLKLMERNTVVFYD